MNQNQERISWDLDQARRNSKGISEENRENQILEKSDASVSFFSWGTIKQGDIMKSKGRIKLKRDQVHKGYFWGLGLKIDSHLCSGFYLAKLKHLNLDENSQCVLLKVSLKKNTFDFNQSDGKKHI